MTQGWLYNHQEQSLDGVRQALRSYCRVILQGPTGVGKTRIMCAMAAGAAARRKRAVFVVHRRELLDQASRSLEQLGLAHGLIAPGQPMTQDLLQVASIDTLVRRLDKIMAPALLILDECHHATSATWRRLLEAWPASRVVGLTATPCRLDGQGLGDIFETMVIGPTVRWLIDNGYLADFKVYAPPIGIDTDGVAKRAGDFAKDALARLIDKPGITGDAVRHYQQLAPGKQAIVFCVSIQHSRHMVDQFRAAGVRAEHLDGTEDRNRRRQIVDAFGRGEIRVLSNVELFGEGFDVPAAEVAILLRPTQSLGLHLQQVGRVLRPAPGKESAIILDHAGNCLRHGLPDDDREWTLEGRKKGTAIKAPPVRQCPVCFTCHRPTPQCPTCGHVYGAQPREVEERAGDLEEVNKAEVKRLRRDLQLREQAGAKTIEDLTEIGRARGYQNPERWAEHVWHGRQKKRAVA